MQIYERKGALLHSKTAVIDGVWSTVGSTNLDWRSFLDNDEVNAVILGRDFAAQMQAMFEKDLGASDAIDLESWESRSPSPAHQGVGRAATAAAALALHHQLCTFAHGTGSARTAQSIFHQPVKETNMNWDRIEGNWKQFKGNVKEQWGKLTDDQLDVIAGKRDHLAGKIQESYGITKDETEKQLADWQKKMKDIPVKAAPEQARSWRPGSPSARARWRRTGRRTQYKSGKYGIAADTRPTRRPAAPTRATRRTSARSEADGRQSSPRRELEAATSPR